MAAATATQMMNRARVLMNGGSGGCVPPSFRRTLIASSTTLLAERQLKVTDRCRGFITETPGYSWDPDATEKGEDKPLKVADHSLDAQRYILTTTEDLWRPHLRDQIAFGPSS